MPPLLELDDVSARYGQVAALHGVSLTVDDGEVVALLGANGAGKTTTLRAVSGTVRRSGDVVFGGKRLGRAGPEAVARAGIAHVPEGRGIFAELTVWENLRMGAYMRRGRARLQDGARATSRGSSAAQPAGRNALGRRAADARARARVPPAAAAPDARRAVARARAARHARGVPGRRRPQQKEGLAVLVVEQNAAIALAAAHRAYVLETGSVAARAAPPTSCEPNDAVRSAYLGY